MGSFWGSHQYNSSLETSKHTAIFHSRWIGRLWRSDLFKDNTSCSGWNPEFWCSCLRAIGLCWGPGEPRWALGRGYCCSCFCPWNWAEAGPFLPFLSDLPFLRASGWCSVLRSHPLLHPSGEHWAIMLTWWAQWHPDFLSSLGPFHLTQGTQEASHMKV